MCNRNVGGRYFFKLGAKPSPPKDLFLKEKPANGYRIFVMGGSTAFGFPYDANIMFSRILNFRLADVFPDKHIEVINTAMTAVNSFTLLDFMDEILEQQPDVILIYAGHNEFYGAMGVGSVEKLGKNAKLARVYLKLTRFKTFLLVRQFVGAIQKSIAGIRGARRDADPTKTLMARIVAEQTIPYKSELYNLGMNHFEENLRLIFEKAKKKNVPIIISELVSNIKDQPPFVSVKTDSFPTAQKAFRIGKKLEARGKYNDAKTALTLAKDLDALRFRASGDCNKIIRKVAKEFKAPVAPMESRFARYSEHGLPGNEVFVEHLHPNIDGYFIMADAFFDVMRENKFISSHWNEQRIFPSDYYKSHWGLTAVDSVSAEISIHYLKGGWPFKPKGTPNYSLDDWHSTTKVESLAVRILTEKSYGVIDGHLDMAKYYEKKGDFENAFKEYKALYYIIPFEAEFYRGAVENLFKMRRFNDALVVLALSQKYIQTSFADKWMGRLFAAKKEYAKALPCLEKAVAASPDDPGLLSSLAMTYKALGEQKKAIQTLQQLQKSAAEKTKINPADQQASQLYTTLLEKAKGFLKAKDYQKALPLLMAANDIKETTFTLKWIGLLELKGGKPREAVTFMSKAAQRAPQDFELHYNLCNAHIILGQKKEAQQVLLHLEKIRPGFNDPQNLRQRLAAIE